MGCDTVALERGLPLPERPAELRWPVLPEERQRPQQHFQRPTSTNFSPISSTRHISLPQPLSASLYLLQLDRMSSSQAADSSSARSATIFPTPSSSTQQQLEHSLDSIQLLWDAEQASIESRSDRRTGKRRAEQARERVRVQACVACRRNKNRCENVNGAACDRCSKAGLECVYPEEKKRGPKQQLSK